MELPAHPQSDDSGRDQHAQRSENWGTRLAIAALVALVAAVVLLHLTGVVGPGGH